MERLNNHANDPMSELLRSVKVHSTVYCLSDLRAPWGFKVEDSSVAKFHLVLEGSCELSLDGGEPESLGPGELVLLATGRGHAVKDRPGSRTPRLERILAEHPVDDDARLVYGGRGRRTRLLCGGFALVDPLPNRLLGLLPDVLKLDAAASGLSRWLEPLFGLLRDETERSEPGAAAVFAKIADVFLAQTLRSYLAGAEHAGLVQVAPFQDPAVSRAVDLLHSRPRQQWAVANLAREVGMSRTGFTIRFRDLVGETPMRYLTKVRLSQAAGYLMTTNDNLLTIAGRTGYDSEASLSKAFKRQFGNPPGEYRRLSAATLIPVGIDPRPGRSDGDAKRIASKGVMRSSSGSGASSRPPASASK